MNIDLASLRVWPSNCKTAYPVLKSTACGVTADSSLLLPKMLPHMGVSVLVFFLVIDLAGMKIGIAS